MTSRHIRTGLVAALAAAVVAAPFAGTGATAASGSSTPGKEPKYAAKKFDPVVEAKNYSNLKERQAIYLTPKYQKRLRTISVQNQEAQAAIQLHDPARSFPDVCASGNDGCAGDVRLY